MGDSIAAGVAACPDADGWLIVLGDMPFILPSSIERVVAAIADDAVSVPVQDGEFGHPVGFGRSFGPGLQALSGDRGARPLFTQGRVVEVAVDDPGVLWDIDVPEALVFKPARSTLGSCSRWRCVSLHRCERQIESRAGCSTGGD